MLTSDENSEDGTIIKNYLLKFNLAALLCCSASIVLGNELIIYPADGQTKAQQQTDESECIVWAKDYSGFDPLASHSVAAESASRKQGGAVRGAAGGAAVGAIVGNSDDAKKGAAAGAVLGRMRQNRQNRQAQSDSSNKAASAQASLDGDRKKFDSAYSVCLEGRGYSVKTL
jgi:hypothetical protein